MPVAQSIRSTLAPVHREGWPFVGAFFLASVILGWFWTPFFWLGLVLTAWCAYFFRDPMRVTPQRDGLIVAPADGRVLRPISAVPPAELDLGDEALTRISIFMNVFDCHVNRAPVTGRVATMAYRPGVFLDAENDKASDENERNAFVFEAPGAPGVSGTPGAGLRLGVVQIAGLVARRIVPFVREGSTVAAGDRIGLIRFGSRVDVYLPAGVRPLVGEGSRTVAGETIIADLRSTEGARAFRRQ